MCILASFLAIIIGGGNYTTALVSTIITFLILVYVFKNKLSYKSLYIIIFLFLLVPFIISIIAPGNSVRAALEQSGGMSAIKSIIMSVFYAFVYLGTWTKLPQIIIFIFITPILFVISKNVNFRFKYPIIAIVLSFLCFSAQLTPPLYALSSVGSERQIDIYYYSYYLLIAFNIFYISGWINRKEIIDIKLINNFIIKNFIPISAVLLLLFAAGCFEYGIKNLTSVDTALSVLNGSVYEYDKEYDTAIEQIISGNGVVEEIKTVPDFFGELKISKDSDYWINRQLAGYFNVDKVELKE